jgi:hypothetical protein
MKSGQIKDASTTPQVWTRGRVEKVAVMVNNSGLRLVKIRVVQDRIPELGDKFCLTPDHDVMTDKGWKGIADITLEDKVLTLVDGTTSTYANPTELYKFDCNDEELYHVSSYEVDLLATMSHKMYVRSADESSFSLKEARTIVGTPHHYLTWCMDGMKETSLQENVESIVKYTGSVYCFEVPSHVFYVRRNGKAVWTGNSNRHGQKGTIGALLRGHDMPRTESGIVPDMIMNPHAIPSRMTIAQNLEQLLGKTAALSGCIGDGTSFMNDGSPQEAIGGILEQMGFEKYGNEVMYNGATGEQINAHIFIGPVYGMRLKHMVEDKWQARGEGRREMRTHQPTGGRGAQGGLKIGEMDRDAIIGHAGMAFVKESFMERSDGTTMPMCVACGMIPIHNPRLNISICPMCDGPVKYTGDSVNNLEILPPLGRPKSKIVQVEMPYSTKLLTQEQETFLNLSMRYITTSGVQRLKQLELSGKASESVRELPEFILPETKVPAYIEEKDMEPKFTIDQLRSMGASIVEVSKDRMEELDTIAEEVIDLDGAQPMVQQPVDLQMAQPQMQSMTNQVIYPNQMVQPQMAQPQAPMVQPQMVQPQMVQPQMVQSQMQPSSVVGGMPTPNFPSQMGGFIAPYIPSSGGMLVVDTSPGAMVADGIGAQQGGRRNVRRSFGGDPFASSPAPMMSAAMPSSSGGSTPTFTINKLE